MKKINSLFAGLLLTASVCCTQQANAQAPQSMTYQSVIRNSSNALVANTAVGIKISVLQGSSSGNEAYVETQTATTNANGLVSLQIGAGTADIGSFSQIDWANGPYFIKTEIDPTGGSNYSITGTQQMASVPYALYAAKSGGTVFETTADDPTAIHNTNPGNVGIGTDLPSEKLDVSGNVRVRGTLGIGTQVPNASAALEINSTTGALLLPRMTTAERNNLNATEGMIIYNTSDASYQGYSNTIVNADPVVDQSQLAIDNAFFPNDKSQSFTAGLSGALTSVRVLLNSFGGPQTGTIYIRDGAGNSGAILYQSTATISYNDGGNWVTINPSGVNLIAGNVYSINIVNQGGFGPESEIVWICRIDVDNYPGGNLFWGGDAFGGDGVFETTVTPSPTGSLQWGNFSNASTASTGATGATGPSGSSSFQTTADDATAIHNTNAGNVGIGTDLPSEKLDVNGNLKVRNNATVNGTLGIRTIDPVTNFQINDKVVDDGQFTYDTNTAYLVHPDPTSSTVLNDPKTLLLLARQGTNGEAYGAGAAFNLSRYEDNGAGSRTRLDFNLANENFMQNATNVMTLLSNGNVGIGNTAPAEKMEVTGNVKASSFVKTGGTSSQYLMADGSTSVGVINEGSFVISFSNITSVQITLQYKEITEGSSKIVHLYIPAFTVSIFNGEGDIINIGNDAFNNSIINSINSTSMPVSIRPSNKQVLPCNIISGSTGSNYGVNLGLFAIDPSGEISLILPSGQWEQFAGTAFDQTITYVVN